MPPKYQASPDIKHWRIKKPAETVTRIKHCAHAAKKKQSPGPVRIFPLLNRSIARMRLTFLDPFPCASGIPGVSPPIPKRPRPNETTIGPNGAPMFGVFCSVRPYAVLRVVFPQRRIKLLGCEECHTYSCLPTMRFDARK